MIRGVSHIAVGVADIDDALTFYRDVVGLHPIADKLEEFPGMLDATRLRRRAVYLANAADDSEAVIVLDQDLTGVQAGAPSPLFARGIHHFGLWVDDLDAVVQRATAAGVTVITPVADRETDYWMPENVDIRSVFLEDPDGNYVQLDVRTELADTGADLSP